MEEIKGESMQKMDLTEYHKPLLSGVGKSLKQYITGYRLSYK